MKKFVILIAVLTLFSCKNERNSNILRITDNLLHDRPDKALHLLDSIGFDEKFSENEKMHYVWNKAKAHQMLGESLVEDTLLPQAVAYYKEVRDTARLLDGYLLMASYQNWTGRSNLVIASLDSGYLKAVTLKNIPMMVSFLGSEAEFFYRLHDYNNAIKKINDLLRFSENISPQQQYRYTYMLGLNMSLANNPSYSDYYRKSIQMALSTGDTASACEFMRNYAGSLSGDHQYSKSNSLLHKIERLMPQIGQLSAIQMVMAENYVNMHRLDSASKCFKAATVSEKKLQAEGYYDIARRGGLEMLKYLLDYETGHHVSLSTFSRYCDSISNDIKMRRDTEIKQVEGKRRLQSVNYELRLERVRMWWFLVVLIAILTVASIGVYIYIRNRYYRLAEAENRIDTLTRLVEDAKSSTTDNPQSADNAFFKKTLMKQLGIIKLVASMPTNQNQELLRRISAISGGEIHVDELLSWSDLYPLIDSLHDNFYTRLMEKYGYILKDKEVKICCLLCAGFSTKEIGVVTQQSDATIYVRKSAIRRKIGIDEKQDIVDFINRI